MDSRNREYFDRGLKNAIDSFERAKEWADLSNCLQKAKQQIEKNKGLPIPRQRDLAKRLGKFCIALQITIFVYLAAQCLNPEINVIHQLTLEVYKEVFEREIQLMKQESNSENVYERKSSVALFFSGLFNFYQFAAFEVKQTFLELISCYLLKMKKELILSLPGFMLCMLPALEEQNGEILKKVEKILADTEKIVGTSEFYGEIWKAMLRTPRARLPAIKYLDKKIPKNLKQAQELKHKDKIFLADYTIKIVNHEVKLDFDDVKSKNNIERLGRMDIKDFLYFYYPNKNQLVINALVSGLQLAEINYVNRATLDFLISHMPLKDELINTEKEKIRLVESASLTYTNRDFATLNKLQHWLFEQFDDEEEINSLDPTVIAIVESQKNLFRQSMDPKIKERVRHMQRGIKIGQNQQSEYRMLMNNPILILLRIMSDENGITVPILKNISIHLIEFIKYHLPNVSEVNALDRDDKKFILNLRNFLEQIYPQYHAVLDSLAKKLNLEIDNVEFDKFQKTIDVISYAIFDMKNLWNNLLDTPQSRQKLTEILSTMLTGLKKISDNNQNLELIQPTLGVVERILDTFQQMNDFGVATLITQKNNEKFKVAIENFNQLYVMMCEKLINTPSDQINTETYKLELNTFKKYNNIMFKIMLLQNIDSNATEMPKWLEMLIKCSKFEAIQICLVSVAVFIKILQYEDRFYDAQENKVVKHSGEKFSAIINIQRLIAIQNSNTKMKKLKGGPDFKKQFLMILQEKDDPETKKIVQNLWSQLDKEIDTYKIVNHLKELDLLVPKIFSDVIIQDLNQDLQGQDPSGMKNKRVQQDQAIKKFTTFWKHTSHLYPTYKPFETEVHRKKYCALHNMINFLEHTDPTLRLSCRSWLSQNNKQYNRILDPIIEEFIQNSKFIQKQGSDNVFIESKFETQYVIENFGKLRNIILNTQDEIIDYMVTRGAQHHIAIMYEENKNRNQVVNTQNAVQTQQNRISMAAQPAEVHLQTPGGYNDTVMKDAQNLEGQISSIQNYSKIQIQRKPYLDMLVEITLRFIQAEYQQDFKNQRNQMNVENQLAETLTVNASACEFMELILKQVQRDPLVSYRIAHMIIKPLINTFYTVIENNNYAMMVNIINLLDLILNECNFQGQRHGLSKEMMDVKNIKQQCEEIFIFKNNVLLLSIKDGLSSNLSFVRQKFIRFVEMLVPYMRKFTKENESFKDTYKMYIKDLMDIFCQLLRKVDVSFYSAYQKNMLINQQKTENEKESKENLQNSQPNMSITRINQSIGNKQGSNMESSDQIEYNKKWQIALQKLVINQETDIIQIVGGLQVIINTVLDIKSNEGQSLQDMRDMEAENNEEDDLLIGKNTKNDQNKNQGFFGGIFGGGETTGYFAADIFADVKTVVYEKLSDVIVSCVYSWNHLPLLSMTDYHFTRYGMFAYSQEDTKKIMDEIKQKRTKFDSDITNFTFEKLLQISTNPIQKRIISLLRPIAKKIPDQFIEGVLHVWLHKSLLKGTNEDNSYQKIIQMLICVYQAMENPKNNRIDYIMPVYKVIDSVIKYIQDQEQKHTILVHQKKWQKNNPPALSVKHSQSETLLCQFLFAYLVYNPTMYDPLLDRRPDDKSKEFHKVYINIIKFFNMFKMSRNPFTICWSLEILNTVCMKFTQEDAKLDTRLKKEYHEMFNNMLSNCAQIMVETFNIQFEPSQKYQLALPPTVYELLFRYEYMQFKHKKDVVENKDWNQEVKETSPMKQRLSMIRQHQEYKSIVGDALDVIQMSGSLFFDDNQLENLVSMKFEYVHSDQMQSIFKNVEILMKDRENLTDVYMNQSHFMEDIKLALRGYEDYTTPDKFLIHTKFYTIITLKQILCNILPNLIGVHDLEKTNKSLQIIFSKIIELLQMDKKSLIPHKDKFCHVVMIEFITEFFASIVERTHGIDSELIKPYRREIIDLFNNENFFKMSLLNLKQWQKIMKYFIDGKPEEILQEQMQLWNFQGGLFANNNSVIIQKCYAMKRIAFLIFSCEDDEFQNQLDMLMKKMIEVFKQKQKNDIKQRLFLFFLTRVMLIRLNFQALTDALRKLWPHLLNELISVFEVKDEHLDKDNTELTIEAIKLVELLSSLNIEDFQMNQWIFLIDGYGMKLETKKQNLSIKKLDSSDKSAKKVPNKILKTEENNIEVFKTFIVKFIGDQEYSFYNVDDPLIGSQNKMPIDELVSIDDSSFKGRNPQSTIHGEQQSTQTSVAVTEYTKLQEQAASLQQSINDSNVIGNEFNRQEAEAKIEHDFLINDEMLQNKN